MATRKYGQKWTNLISLGSLLKIDTKTSNSYQNKIYDAYFVDKQWRNKIFNLELGIYGLFLNFATEKPPFTKGHF
jgi:hypothetical protein